MKKIDINKLGWVAAVGLLGVMLGSGFQGTGEKFAVVDLGKVVEESNFGKQNQETFKAMKASREGILEFMDQYRVLTPEQATKLRDLSLKPNPTADDKAQLETLKAEAIAAWKKYVELTGKPNLTPEERTLMQEYARRGQTIEDTAQRWYREFSGEMQAWLDQQKVDSIKKAREAIQEAGKAGGFTVVLESSVAPYGVNDVTDASLKAMNAKK